MTSSQRPHARLRRRLLLTVVIVIVGGVWAGLTRFGIRYRVEPFRETDQVPSSGDAADDPCIWVAKDDPARSLILATDKKSGLCVFDLDGRLIQHLAIGRLNNVDVRDDFPFEDATAAIVAASNKDRDAIDIFALDPATREIRLAFEIAAPDDFEPDGLCLHRDRSTGEFHVVVTTKLGELAQFRLTSRGGEVVRRIRFDGESEGCVADDELGRIYVSEENVGIWRLSADPATGDRKELVDSVGVFGRLDNDVEGLAIWKGENESGYLVASNQGADDYLVYERGGANRFVGRFSIGNALGIDSVRHTDGIDITSANLGPNMLRGLLVVQDDLDGAVDESGRGRQNFKLVSWDAIERVIVRPF